MKISEYIDRRDKLTNTLFLINSDGEGYYVENHKLYTREEFNRRYPLPVSLIMHNGSNADGSKNYLHTD